jgi:hypothetical protein
MDGPRLARGDDADRGYDAVVAEPVDHPPHENEAALRVSHKRGDLTAAPKSGPDRC